MNQSRRVAKTMMRAGGGGNFAALGHDVVAGLMATPICIAYSLATGALIFSGPLQPFIGRGVAAGLVTTAISAIVFAVISSFRAVVSCASSNTAAPLAAIMALVAPTLAQMPPAAALATAYLLIGVVTVGTGGVLMGLGWARLGKLVRFIPFPVVAGFMATTGWLLVAGAFRLVLGVPLRLDTLAAYFSMPSLFVMIVTIVWAIILAQTTARFRHPMVLPALLLGAVLFTNLIIWRLVGHAEGELASLFFASLQSNAAAVPLLSGAYADADWSLILSVSGDILAFVLLILLLTLLSITGLEASLDEEANYDRELWAQGVSTFASGLAGGFVGLSSVSITTVGRAAGGRGRAVGIATGLLTFVVLVAGSTAMTFVPRFVIGGLLLQIGVRNLWVWCLDTRRNMPRAEWLLVIGILAAAVWFGFLASIVCGIVGGCVIFAMDASRVSIVRRMYGLHQRASPLVRSQQETSVLAARGDQVEIVELSGFIFFGSAYQLFERVKTRIAAQSLLLLVLDFSGVTGFGSSTSAVLTRLRKLLHDKGIAYALAGAPAKTVALLHGSRSIDGNTLIYADRDEALERGEDMVLTAAATPPPTTIPLQVWLSEALGTQNHADRLIPLLRERTYEPGAYLCKQGEPTDTLLFIETGRVNVTVGPAQKSVRIFGPHTLAGEHGFVLALPRTANLKVEETARVWSLDRNAFEHLQADQPDLVIALMRYIVQVQSERLSFATRQAAALAG